MQLTINHDCLIYQVKVSSYHPAESQTRESEGCHAEIDYDILSITPEGEGFSIEDIVQGDIEFTDIVIAEYVNYLNNL